MSGAVMTKTSDAAVASTPGASAPTSSFPAELDGKTSEELSAQLAIHRQLGAKRDELAAARAELIAAEARTGSRVPVWDDEQDVGNEDKISGYSYLGAKSAGVPAANERILSAERDVELLEDLVWQYEPTVLEAALAAAEKREDLTVAEIRGRIDAIEKQRARRNEELAESQALQAAAERARADVDDAKDVSRLEVMVARRTREVTARRSSLERELEDTQRELVQLRAALPVAEAREIQDKYARELADLNAQVVVAVRDQVKAVSQLFAADENLAALGHKARALLAEATRATGMPYDEGMPEWRAVRRDLPIVRFASGLMRPRDLLMDLAREIGALKSDADA